jgi:hypothetical protein
MGKQFTRLPERGPEPALKTGQVNSLSTEPALEAKLDGAEHGRPRRHNPATLAPGKPSDGVTTSRQRRGAPTKTRNKDHADRVLKREVRGAIQPDRSAAFRTHDCKRGRGRALRRKVSFGSFTSVSRCPRHFRLSPNSGGIADIAGCLKRARNGLMRCNKFGASKLVVRRATHRAAPWPPSNRACRSLR